ncbi:ABC transporter substrate-binding protein [Variovorax sp. RCC_210]|uniref:ABC transporter substrate-binding protein n=1 Tax=Variovorax sp. RCC_210 TaxID=3239217 RepID=UPI0035233B5E
MKRFVRANSRRGLLAAALLGALAGPLCAQTLTVGLKGEPMSLDPAFRAITTDMVVARHIFEPLVTSDADMKLKPALATEWKLVEPTAWVFKLRPGVKFSDGTPFTADDVVFSFERALKVPNSPSPMSIFARGIQRVKAVDPLTVRIETDAPNPSLPRALERLMIMSKKSASGPAPEGKTTAQLNGGDGLVGTGPFVYVSWTRGAEIALARNPLYWGEPVHWQKVVLRFVTNPAARISALLSGGIDIIEDPTPDDLPRLLKDPQVKVSSAPTTRLVYIGLDTAAPKFAGLDANPLKDVRVRRALALAIDRKVLGERIMEDVGLPTAGTIAPMMEGGSAAARLPAADVAGAKKLLQEAGYPNGFTMTLGAPNGRYINDAKVAQAVASMWGRAGVKVSLDTPTTAIFFKNLVAYDYPSHITGWADLVSTDRMRALFATRGGKPSDGATNYERYSNRELDALIERASSTLDEAERIALVRKIEKTAVEDDVAVIPLHFEKTAMAMRKGLSYATRADQIYMSQYVRAAGAAVAERGTDRSK